MTGSTLGSLEHSVTVPLEIGKNNTVMVLMCVPSIGTSESAVKGNYATTEQASDRGESRWE